MQFLGFVSTKIQIFTVPESIDFILEPRISTINTAMSETHKPEESENHQVFDFFPPTCFVFIQMSSVQSKDCNYRSEFVWVQGFIIIIVIIYLALREI